MQDYYTPTVRVKAELVTKFNLRSLASLCGGEVIQDETLRVPTIQGPLDVEQGAYLLQNQETGRWIAMTAEEFNATYVKTGVRRDLRDVFTPAYNNAVDDLEYGDNSVAVQSEIRPDGKSVFDMSLPKDPREAYRREFLGEFPPDQ